ncbi:MAG TPA: PIN domain-containing protein, partial [Terriglobia bacterium]|nr:PIN domain-containing protein [Terriglobia bacterium]
MAWVLDTSVLSELRRPKADPRVVTLVARCPLDQLYISAVTLGEIRFGIGRVGEPGRWAELDNWPTEKMRPIFSGRVLPIAEDIVRKWGLLVE